MKKYDVIRFLREQSHNVDTAGVTSILTGDEQEFYYKLCEMYQFLTQEERYVIDYLYVKKVGNYETCAKTLNKTVYQIYKIRKTALNKLYNLIENENKNKC